ncbi:hypothetical protein BSKO_07161 [Bryopsis sp. KO-2023]|nr:hypothetical protein BSKO_07161 [Bryopsis sp. KO-2023]
MRERLVESREQQLKSDLQDLRQLQQELDEKKANSNGYAGDGDTMSANTSDKDASCEEEAFGTDAYYTETEAETLPTEAEKENNDGREEEEDEQTGEKSTEEEVDKARSSKAEN